MTVDIRICAPADVRALARWAGVQGDDVTPGLGSTAITPLIQRLLERGNRITLYTLSRGLASEQFYDWGDLRVFVGPSRTQHTARTFFSEEIRFLKQAIASDGADVVHAHWTYEFALAPLRLGVPTLVTIHDLPWYVLNGFRDMYRAVRLAMAYEVAARGKHFTAVSVEAARHFQRYFNPRADMTVIPNGLRDELLARPEATSRQASDKAVFGTILQGWSGHKNPKGMLRAFAKVRSRIPDAELRMYGTGYEPSGGANRWASRWGLDRGVTFIGPVPHAELLTRIESEVDVVVHPSLNEAFAMTILEAMTLGKPIIAGAKTPGMPELLDAGRCGVLTDVMDSDALAEAMVKLSPDRALRAELGEKARARVRAHFRLDGVAEQYERVYQALRGDRKEQACLCC